MGKEGSWGEGEDGSGKGERTYVVPHQHAINKLYPPNNHEEGHEGIDELRPLGRLVDIAIPEVCDDFLGAGARAR